MPWKCSYKSPSVGPRPFTSLKLRDIAKRVCESEGGLVAAQASLSGILECEGEALFGELCEGLEVLDRALVAVRDIAEDVGEGVEVAIEMLVTWKILNPIQGATIAAVVKVLQSEELIDGVRDLAVLIGCSGFSTGGGFGGEDLPITGGGF